MKRVLILVVGFILLGVGCVVVSKNLSKSIVNSPINKTFMSYRTNIIKDTQENDNFRRVLFTGKNSQLVVMSIPPGGEVGEETHKFTEQTIFFLSGTGEAILDGKLSPIVSGDVVVVTPGTKHNFKNTSNQDLKIYTTYAPPNHIDGRVHRTKADADADVADEAVGESAPLN